MPSPISKSFEQACLAKRIFIIGFLFMVYDLLAGGTMSPRTYGYIAYDIDAKWWAGGQMTFSALCLYGLMINGKAPLLTPILRLIGWSMLAVMFCILAISAAMAEDGVHITLIILVIFLPDTATYCATNARDLWKRRGWAWPKFLTF